MSARLIKVLVKSHSTMLNTQRWFALASQNINKRTTSSLAPPYRTHEAGGAAFSEKHSASCPDLEGDPLGARAGATPTRRTPRSRRYPATSDAITIGGAVMSSVIGAAIMLVTALTAEKLLQL